MRSKQETFDLVLDGMRKQGRPSFDGVNCRYRSDDGCKCAVGLLIPGDAYDPEMEDQFLVHRDYATIRGQILLMDALEGHEISILRPVQMAHDKACLTSRGPFMAEFEANMARIAEFHGLEYTPPGEEG